MDDGATSIETMPEGFRLRASCRSAETGVYRTIFAGCLCWIPFQLWGDLIRGLPEYEGIDFWAATLFLGAYAAATLYAVALALMALFGEMRVTRRGDAGEIFVGIGPVGRTRRIRWSDFQRAGTTLVGLGGTGRKAQYLVLEGPSNRIKVGWMLPRNRQEWVAAMIQKKVFAR